MTIATNGHTITVAGSLVSSSSSTSFQVNTTTLNSLLATDGSAYQFSALGVSSDWSGSTGSQGASLQTSGGLFVLTGGTGVTGALTITVSEDGFLAPTGKNGSLESTSIANFTNTTAGDKDASTSSYQGTPGTILVSTSTGPVANDYSPNHSDSIGTVSSGYTLGNLLAISLTKNTTSEAQLGFSGTAQVFAASVPEPASLVMMLTGMPLPLVVLGLLRRRRRAAA